MADTASDILNRLYEIGDSFTSQCTRGFFYALGSRISASLEYIITECEKSMCHCDRAKLKVVVETEREGLTGVVMDNMVQKRLYTNFDWQTWVAAIEKVEAAT